MKKRKRNYSSSIQTRSKTKTITAAKTTATTTTTTSYLPDECWQRVFKFILNKNSGENNYRYLEPLSLVSKQFLFITNGLRSSLKINSDLPKPYLRRIFQRFTNLTSLDFTHFMHFRDDFNKLLCEISCFSIQNFNLKSLKISDIPENGLRVFSEKITTLTSLTISDVQLCNQDFVVIFNCFPFIEELDMYRCLVFENIDDGLMAMSKAFPKLRKINLPFYNSDINESLILNLCKNCEFLEDVNMFHFSCLTQDGIASAVRERPGLTSLTVTLLSIEKISSYLIDSLVGLKSLTCLDLTYSRISDELLYSIAKEGLDLRRLVLRVCTGYSYAGILGLLSKCRCIQHLDLEKAEFLSDRLVSELSLFLCNLVSINLSHCKKLTDSTLFTLARNCPLLSEIKMEKTSIGENTLENSNSMMNNVVNPQLKSLCLAHNSCMKDENIIMFASIFPNLHFLDLSCCDAISKGIGEVLKRCCKIKHLDLGLCLGLKLLRMNFNVSTLEVLKLSASKIYDRSLYAISKSCFGLLQLDLEYCDNVTEKGVREVVNKCTKLREISMLQCHKVNANVVEYIVIIRPTLRKITAPPSFRFNGSKREFFLRHGCLVR